MVECNGLENRHGIKAIRGSNPLTSAKKNLVYINWVFYIKNRHFFLLYYNKNMIKQGVIYVAVGKKSILEVNNSINSLKKNMPDIHVTVFTDELKLITNKVDSTKLLKLTNNFKLDRMKCFLQSPYKHTLYLDADTYVCADLNDLFRILKKFDFAVAQSPISYDFFLKDIPNSFHQMNCGVMLYSNSKTTTLFLKKWIKTHIKLEKSFNLPGDETSFRKTIYSSKIRFAIFPNTYNFRINTPNIIRDPLKIKIIHGHSHNIEDIHKKITKKKNTVFYIPKIKNKNIYDCIIKKI